MKNKGKKIVSALLSVAILALLIIGGLLFLKIQKIRKYNQEFSMGAKYLKELDYENAEICFKKAIEINEKRVDAYVELSIVYVKQQRYEEAYQMLDKAMELMKEDENSDTDWIDQQLEIVGQKTEGNPEQTQEPSEDKEEKDEPIKASDEELFAAFIKEQRVPQLGRTEMGPFEKNLSTYNEKWFYPEGIISAYCYDLDDDGSKELLEILIEKVPGDEFSECQMYGILANVYEIEDGAVILADSQAVTPYYMDEHRYITFSEQQWAEFFLYVTIVPTENGTRLFFEQHDIARIFADGQNENYWSMEYKNKDLRYVRSFTQTQGGSSDFAYTGYKFDQGVFVKEELLYSMWTQEGVLALYSDMHVAVDRYFDEIGITLQHDYTTNSILAGEGYTRIMEYGLSVQGSNYPDPGGVLKLEVKDYGAIID